ncbi:MAG: NAD-dependent deacylase, partial [Atopobium sp.]|nr:NAD-dependent deacylase [Atopobium sp.]
GHTYMLDQIEEQSSVVPLCQCGAVIRPDIVFYGEGLDMDTVYGALNAISQAEVLVVAGSSLVVQPAAGLLDYYKGNKMAIINDQPTPYDGRANLVIRDRIGAVIEQLL